MELTLSPTAKAQQIAVTVDGRFSHHFNLGDLVPNEKKPGGLPQPLADPQTYGRAVYEALFPTGRPSAAALAARPERILLVAGDNALQSIPWEYAHSAADGYLVRRCAFVRGLPPEQRGAPPDLSQTALHITAVPSDPLDPHRPRLAIEEEWLRLAGIVEEEGAGIHLERVRPPTIAQLRRQVAGHKQRVIHFMGHGGRGADGAALIFEKESGAPDPVSAGDFIDRVGENAFLVTLNACVSATPGATAFDNAARALVEHGVPYALGMRFTIGDDDARLFSRTFTSELAAAVPVEQALRQARLALAKEGQDYAIGVPVLYTSLAAPAAAFAPGQGAAQVDQHQAVKVQLDALPRTDGRFHGRARELLAIGARLTADRPPRLLTIHGVGGQGKTAVARQAAERFSFPFRAGVYAVNLESLPGREQFLAGLARFLALNPDDFSDAAALPAAISERLTARRLLLILDNAETLLQAVEREEEGPRRLMGCLRQELALPTVTLLVTTRRWTGWPDEELLELDGLPPDDGAALFRAATPRRAAAYSMDDARRLSARLAGHPLSLRLLAAAYNAADPLPFPDFVAHYEAHLLAAHDPLHDEKHRQRSLAASLKTSLDFLPDAARDLLSGLWVWHGPFLPEMAVQLFDPDRAEDEGSEIPARLALLHQRGLLAAERPVFAGGPALLYRLLPSLRPYIAQMAQMVAAEELLARFGQVMATMLRYIYDNLQKGGLPVYLAQQGVEDLDRGLEYVAGETAVSYRRRLGWVMQQLGRSQRGRGAAAAGPGSCRGGLSR